MTGESTPEKKEEEKHFLLDYVFVTFINDCSGQLHKLRFFKGQIYSYFSQNVLKFSCGLICGQLELLY